MHRAFLTHRKYKTSDLLKIQLIETFQFAVEPAEVDPEDEGAQLRTKRKASRYAAYVERQTAKICVVQDKYAEAKRMSRGLIYMRIKLLAVWSKW